MRFTLEPQVRIALMLNANVAISYDERIRFGRMILIALQNGSEFWRISMYGEQPYKFYRERRRVQWKQNLYLNRHELRLVTCKTDTTVRQKKFQL